MSKAITAESTWPHITTSDDYEKYEAAVAEFFEREGVTNLTGESNTEPSFSWRPCDCCGRHLGGNRHRASGWNPKLKQAYRYRICDDCLYYGEYGVLGDGRVPRRNRGAPSGRVYRQAVTRGGVRRGSGTLPRRAVPVDYGLGQP